MAVSASKGCTPPCRLAISSMSLGRSAAGHSLARRLDMACKYGYEGVEMFFEDVEEVAQTLPPPEDGAGCTERTADRMADHQQQLRRAAAFVADMCAQRRLHVVCLQPFRNYEGLASRESQQARLAELRLWCGLAGLLSTDLILIPSNFLPAASLTADLDLIITDLQAAADVAAACVPPIRLCYEALAWGTHVGDWAAGWDVVRRADRANLGVCLDTFNMAASPGTFADPTAKLGLVPHAAETILAKMDQLVSTLPVDKIFLLQLADAEMLDDPLEPGHPLFDPDQHPCMAWSRNCRLFYGEPARGGFLPLRIMAICLLERVGYRGWISFEVYHRHLSSCSPALPEEMAKRGATSWAKLMRDLGIHVGAVLPTSPQDMQKSHRFRCQIQTVTDWIRSLF